MNSQEVNEYMHRYLDDDLSEAEEQELLAYLQQSPASAAMFDRLKRLNSDLEQLPKVTPPISIVDSILPRLEREEIAPEAFVAPADRVTPMRTREGMRSRGMYKWVGGVAAAAIALTVFISTMLPDGPVNDTADDSLANNAANGTAEYGAASAMNAESAADARKLSAEHAPAADGGQAMGEPEMTVQTTGAGSDSANAGGEKDTLRVQDQHGFANETDAASPKAPAKSADPNEQQFTIAGGPDQAVTNLGDGVVDEPIYSLGFVEEETASVVSPDQSLSAEVRQTEAGDQIVLTDKAGKVIYTWSSENGTVSNLHWSEDGAELRFDVTTAGGTKPITVVLKDVLKTAND